MNTIKRLVKKSEAKPNYELQCWSWSYISSDTGAKSADMGVTVLEPGQSHELDQHIAFEEMYYVLEGKGRCKIGGTEYIASAGDAAFVPAGERHQWTNIGSAPLKFIWVCSPIPSAEHVKKISQTPPGPPPEL